MVTELKAEHRVEGIRAFTAFGTRGYGREATAAILKLAHEYPLYSQVVDPTLTHPSAIGQLCQAAQEAFRRPLSGTELTPIDPQDSTPLLLDELQKGNRNSRPFAAKVLADMRRSPETDAKLTAVLTDAVEKERDPEVLRVLAESLFRIDRDGQASAAVVEKVIQGGNPALVEALVNEAGTLAVTGGEYPAPKALPTFKLLLGKVKHPDPVIRRTIVASLARSFRFGGEEILPALMAAYEKSELEDRRVLLTALQQVATNPTNRRSDERRAVPPGLEAFLARIIETEEEERLRQTATMLQNFLAANRARPPRVFREVKAKPSTPPK